MYKPETYTNSTFGALSVEHIEGKIYFSANDVCRALGYANPRRTIDLHCKPNGIRKITVVLDGVHRITNYLSEGNVYRLICQSKKPEAEAFESWVFDELLPTLRTTGGYVNDPVQFVQNWLPNTDEKTKALLVTSLEAVKRQDDIIGAQQESVEFHRAVVASGDNMSIGDFAKCLANEHVDIGRNRLMAWLRDSKYIDSHNVAYQRYVQQGIFTVLEEVYYVGKYPHINSKTVVTPKGQEYLAKRIRAAFVRK